MARIPRKFLAGHCYHVINRGNQRATVFHRPADYDAFVSILTEAQARLEIGLLAACIMPNHFHLVLRPVERGDLSRWMHWLLTTHTARYRSLYKTEGRIWQGRFKAFPIKQDAHLLAVMRYTERNALRAGLVAQAEFWPWGSLHWRSSGQGPLRLTDPPSGLPADWVRWVNEAQTDAELQALRKCVNRQTPFGDGDTAL
jgi:putative transposase